MQLHQDLGVDTTGDYALHDPRLERQLRNSGSNRLIGNIFDPMHCNGGGLGRSTV